MISLYQSDMTTRAIADRLGCSPDTVRRRLVAAGVEIRQTRPNLVAMATGRKGPLHPSFKGERQMKDGYVLIYVPDHPAADKHGFVLEHRRVWEQAHGPIPKGWHVHHINQDRSDNRLENLIALSRSAHAREHASEAGKKAVLVMGKQRLSENGKKGALARWGPAKRSG